MRLAPALLDARVWGSSACGSWVPMPLPVQLGAITCVSRGGSPALAFGCVCHPGGLEVCLRRTALCAGWWAQGALAIAAFARPALLSASLSHLVRTSMDAAVGRPQRRWRLPNVLVVSVTVTYCLLAGLGAAVVPNGVAAVGISVNSGPSAAVSTGGAVALTPARAADGELTLPAVVLRRVEELLGSQLVPGTSSVVASSATHRRRAPRRFWASNAPSRFVGGSDVVPVERRSESQSKALGVDSERTNLTLVVQDLEVGPQIYDAEHWMFSNTDTPFTFNGDVNNSYFANRRFSWNTQGKGNGDCAASSSTNGTGSAERHPTEGSGRVSRGHVHDATVSLGLPPSQLPVNWANVLVAFDGFELRSFQHMNMRTGSTSGRDWAVMGAAGDHRTYHHGSVDVWEKDGSFLLSAYDVRWVQNLSYPGPFGPSNTQSFQIGAYLIGHYNMSRTSAAWASRLDPDGHGIFLAVLQSVAMSKMGCYGSNNYWFTVRPLPSAALSALAGVTAEGTGSATDGVRELPAHRRGRPIASSADAIAASRMLGQIVSIATTVLTSTSVAMVVGSAAVGAAGGSASAGPGQSVIHAVSAGAFMAQMRQVNTFHSDAFVAFSSQFDSFLLRDKAAPWSDSKGASSARIVVHALVDRLIGTVRQAVDAANTVPERNSIAHDLFVGCAFYATIIVGVALCIHILVAIVTWRKPLEVQLNSHKWMVYLLALALTYIFPAAVLNSLQYLLVNMKAGMGSTLLYVVAILQLCVIGIGYTIFFTLVIAYAMHQQRLKKVRWVKREEAPDPEVRQDRFIAGVYEADGDVPIIGPADDVVLGLDEPAVASHASTGSTTTQGRRSRRMHAFHELFACYYDFLRGPLVWLAVLELLVILADCIFVATINSEVLVLSLMLGVHSTLFALFLFLSPFTDKIEGMFFSLVTVLELLMIMMEFASIFSADPLAEQLNLTLVVLGFVTMGLVILCAVWTDVYPILSLVCKSLWSRFTHWRHHGRSMPSRGVAASAGASPAVISGGHANCPLCETSGPLSEAAAEAAAAAKGFAGQRTHAAGSCSSHTGGSSGANSAALAAGPSALVRSSSNQSGASSWSELASTVGDDLEQQALVADVPAQEHLALRPSRAGSERGVMR